MPGLSFRYPLRRHPCLRLQSNRVHEPSNQIGRRVRQEACKKVLLSIILKGRANLAARTTYAIDAMACAASIGLNEGTPLAEVATSYMHDGGLVLSVTTGPQPYDAGNH